jgi:hypothetical protein
MLQKKLMLYWLFVYSEIIRPIFNLVLSSLQELFNASGIKEFKSTTKFSI